MELLELHRRFQRYCLLEEGLSPLTIKGMVCSLNMLMRQTGVQLISDLTLEVLREFFYAGRERHQWSYSTYVNHHKYLKKFLNWCIRNGHAQTNPVSEIKKPRKPQSLPRRLTHAEAQAVIYAAFNYDWRYPFERSRNHALIATLLFAGLRASEVISLQVADVNLDTDMLLVRRGKGGKDRYVPIHRKLHRILERYVTDRDRLGRRSAYMFTGCSRDQPLAYKAIYTICRKLSKTTGVKFTAHCLRHTFGSVAIEQSMGLVQLKEVMGHSNIASTMIYLKMSPEKLKESLNRIDLF